MVLHDALHSPCPPTHPLTSYPLTFHPPHADLVVLHDALDFGQCHLSLGVPMGGRYATVDSLDALRAMPWSEQAPLR